MKIFWSVMMAAVMAALIGLGGQEALADVEEEGPNFGAYALRNGKIFKGGEELKCEVNEVPENIQNGISAWAVIGESSSGSVTAADTGVWFFGEEVDLFLALDSEYEFQGLDWSPKGDRFVLSLGSGVRPDLFFQLYTIFNQSLEFTEPYELSKIAEITGVRGSLQWLGDGMRFVLTRIDDNPGQTGELAAVPHWTRLSAILFDSAAGETIVLKQSTNTQNFEISSVSEDDDNISITEHYVKSPLDWADESKIQERIETVPIPAAG
jgi:hypothetical protein